MTDFQDRLQMMFIQMVPFLMAIVFHEVGHAYVARKHGDNTAERMGRLTLNPIPHIDPIGTLLFPMLNMLTGFPLFFGWARPVPVNYNGLKPYRRGLFLTSLAGPGVNMILSFILGGIFVAIAAFVSPEFYLFEPLKAMAVAGIQINFALALFNLLPLPPLDGAKMIEAFMDFNTARKFESLQSYSFFILLALLWTGVLNLLSYPIIFLSNGTIEVWRAIFGV